MGAVKNILIKIKNMIPNTLTCGNLVSGCIASVMATQYRYREALVFIILGAVFDFFDGFSARMLHAPSPIGKDLDSLADDITFGLAPGCVVHFLLKEFNYPTSFGNVALYIPYIAFLISVFSGLRLAKFNVDTRQTSSFIGMPTPANALFWGSFVVGQHDKIITEEFNTFSFVSVVLLIALTSWLLICEIPMFSLKFKSFGFKENKLRYGFIIASAVLVVFMGIRGFAPIISMYVFLAIVVPMLTPKAK